MEQLNGIRVFIASPGGLGDERQGFRDTVEEVNRDAYERGMAFIPVGWEFATAGLGRPQETINADVRRCDYLVLVLHDRWGTPPSADGQFTSGTEEEYEVARQSVTDTTLPMRNIAVLFKGVDARQLSDPGEQLQKVLAFKDQLEQERGLLYKTFDTQSEFEKELRGMLLRWMRDGEDIASDGGAAIPPPKEPPDPTPDAVPAPHEDEEDTDLLERAAAFADAGRLTQAESLYATAVVARTDLQALTQYTRFLRRTGRLDLAEAMSNRLLEVAEEREDVKGMIEALSNRGIIYRKRGQGAKATADFERAAVIARDAGEAGDLAFLLDNLGLTLRKQGEFDKALDAHREALVLKRRLDDPRSLAQTLMHAGALLRQQGGLLDEAFTMTREALEVFESLDYQRGAAQAHANLGELYELTEDFDKAFEHFDLSLKLNERLNSPEGVGMNLWQLGRIRLDAGNLDDAEMYAVQALRRSGSEGLTRPEAIATPLQLMGKIEIARGDFDEAVDHLESAADIFERNGQALGAAWSWADLAEAHARNGDGEQATRALGRAREIGSDLAHTGFQTALEGAQQLVDDLPDENAA